MCDVSLGLKHSLLITTRVRRKVLRKFWYCKTKLNWNKRKSLHHLIAVSCPTVRVCKSPASILQGTDLGRGTIFGTLSLQESAD